MDPLSLTGSASGKFMRDAPSFLRVSSVAKIGYIPQFKASNARDQDKVSSDLARMRWTCRRWHNKSSVDDMLDELVAIPGGPQGEVLLNFTPVQCLLIKTITQLKKYQGIS